MGLIGEISASLEGGAGLVKRLPLKAEGALIQAKERLRAKIEPFGQKLNPAVGGSFEESLAFEGPKSDRPGSANSNAQAPIPWGLAGALILVGVFLIGQRNG